ncbi:hypothetical protein IW140_002254 [Coemansia sp. RSA 1813]|nr:hypothetical protein EV178_001763 [Coemansia sp. RSA 1646]KAJ1770923.1 hypothetical protein LPJ74_002819 [Coemansia sp. RSA 1843]KAJ2092924.1 hypothetical protein IW138_000637 [Coemansia sp. RSA 986]KAJ2216245.1 hypothetical protein EV179_001483 [Coemansia sp. RSA 487]KAJ2570582.1 hypothetical protein IW140_002254 [Coemansia sp. RSA 1813]
MTVVEPTHTITGKKALSPIALGCGAFSGAYGPAPQDEAVRTVRKALEHGITLLDTSPYYNDSEIKLGKALKELEREFPRSSYSICTKLGRYGYHRSDFDYSASRVVASVQESMHRLHTNYLDIVLCHDVEFVDLSQIIDETLPQLFDLKRKGVIHHVGISGYPLEVLLRIAQIQNKRGNPLDVCLSYCNLNLHCQLLEEYVPKLRAAGVNTIIAASPLSMGLLSGEAPPQWHPASLELKDAVKECADLVRVHNATHSPPSKTDLAEIAESYAFSYKSVDIHLVGAKTAREVEHAVDAYTRVKALKSCSGGSDLSPSINRLCKQILGILRPFSRYNWPSPPDDA